MELYNLLSTADYKLIKLLFSGEVIKRARPYIDQSGIDEVSYDSIRNICTAEVYGSNKYKVSVALEQRGSVVVKCTCPAARDWTPSCKHAAALLIVIMEYFTGWERVKLNQQHYYTSLLDEAFADIKKQQEMIAAGKLPTFAKPTIVFVRVTDALYPYIVLVNSNEKTNKLARIIEKASVHEIDNVLEKLFERSDLLDYCVYTKDGFESLEINKTQVYTPVWRFKNLAAITELTFSCSIDNVTTLKCVPLGVHCAIDLVDRNIIRLHIVDLHCYKYLNDSALQLALGEQLTQSQKGQSIGAVSDIARFMGEKCQITPIQNIRINSVVVQNYFAFPDKELKTARTHCAILDHNDIPVEFPVKPTERRIVADEFYTDNYTFTPVVHTAGKSLSFRWPIGHEDFLDLIQKKYQKMLPAMLTFACSLRDPNSTAESRKQEFFNQPGTKIVDKDFFVSMNSFWTLMSQYDTCKLIYCQETESFSYYVLNKIDLFIPILALINFLVQNKGTFNLHHETTSLRTELQKALIGPLATCLQELGITLYLGEKKVVQRNLDIEIDMEGGNDWFAITPSFYEKGVLLSQKEWRHLLSSTGLFQELEKEVHVFDEQTEKMIGALRTVKASYEPSDRAKQDHFEVPRLHIFTLLSLYKSGIKLKASPEDKAILKSLQNFTHIPSSEIPAKLQCVMRDYQTKGYDWLAFLYKHKFGACLADEMGLGKTVQTIAFLAGIHEGKIVSWDSERKQKHLIIAPATVVGNWEQEIKKFYPEFITTLYLGVQRKLDVDMIDIVLTTYDTIRSDLETFKQIPFHVIVFDEAQAVKNKKSQRTEAAQQLQALFKISLTGTPLENNAQEMCSIMNITLPGLLPEDSVIMNLIKKGEYEAFHERIAPFVLRRTKKEYLQDLPEKSEQDIYLAMTKKQKGLYGAIVDEIKREVYKAYREKTKAQAGIVALTALLRLRQICASPALVDEKQEQVSPKIEYLLAEITKYIKEKTPLLVFSQFVGMLDIVGNYLQKNKVSYLRIDGSVSALQRKKIVEEFQQSNTVFVFLLSLKAGGVGLNLTRASVVIHLDPWWNPAVENQASDRVHRIGQQHDVKVVRLLMKDSVEEKMLVLKQKKKALFDAIMQGTSGARGTAITKQDFDFLLTK